MIDATKYGGMTRPMAALIFIFTFLVSLAVRLDAQPANAPVMPLADVKPGMKGQVWTVFKGSQIEPFDVEVTGVIQNALGPGKSLIVCELTDPRVQSMGAVAGMSGSPLYIDGKLTGALSYQLQKFETVRHAGFTPVGDLMEVSKLEDASDMRSTLIPLKKGGLRSSPDAIPSSKASAERRDNSSSDFQPLRPVFALGGVSPQVTALFADTFRQMGLEVTALGGSTSGSSDPSMTPVPTLHPGSAVSVALVTGDVTMAGTGTVSLVNGNRMVAFGHPMMNLGDTELPMASAEIVTILPSNMSSFKVANTGPIIGTISQDRLSAISGEVGRKPKMVPVEVTVHRHDKTEILRYRVAEQSQLTPVLAATGLAQAILNTNMAGLEEGFLLSRTAEFPDHVSLSRKALYPGPQGFSQGLEDLLKELMTCSMNPFERTFPSKISFTVEALDNNPLASLDGFQLSRSRTHAGDTVQVSLGWRDYRDAPQKQTFTLNIDPTWAGKTLEVALVSGQQLDELTASTPAIAQARNFAQYVAALSDTRDRDGLYLAVVEKASAFVDQTTPTLDYPASVERIARSADDGRYQKRDAVVPLWEKHVLLGRIVQANLRRSLTVEE